MISQRHPSLRSAALAALLDLHPDTCYHLRIFSTASDYWHYLRPRIDADIATKKTPAAIGTPVIDLFMSPTPNGPIILVTFVQLGADRYLSPEQATAWAATIEV